MNDNEYYESKCKVIEAEDIYQLEKKLNDFFKGKFVVSSPIFEPQFENDSYKCIVYYKIPPQKIDTRPSLKPTEKQIKYLKGLGYKEK